MFTIFRQSRRAKHSGYKVQTKQSEAKTEELETNSTNINIRDLCRGINVFKKRYQPTTYTDEKGDLVADSQQYFW
jgi:hypothetical protein